MSSLLVYTGFIIELLNYFSAQNLFVIYSSATLNSANVKLLNRHVQDNYLVATYYYDIEINQNNLTNMLLGENFNLNSSYVLVRPLFLVYVSDEDLQSFNFHLANDLSSSKWLIFVNKSSEIKITEVLEDAYNRPDFCSEVFLVSEADEGGNNAIDMDEIYYRNVKNDYLIVNRFAQWDNETGLQVFGNKSIFTRRSDMSNVTLIVSTVGNYPLTVLLSTDSTKIVGGYFGYTWNALEDHLKFTTQVIITKDKTWGKSDEKGHWDGMIGQVIYNEADAALMDLLMIPERRAVVHFFNPTVSTLQLMIVKKEEIDYIQWLSFLKPLSYRIWICMLSLTLGLPIFMYMFNRKNPEKKKFSECCLETLQIWCQQGGIKRFPKSNAGYIFYTFLYYVGNIILIGYSAALISFLTIVIFIFPFDKIGDMYKTRYNLLMYAGSGLLSTILRSTEKTHQYIIKNQFDGDHLPSSRYEDALDMLCNATRKPYMLYVQKYPLEYVLTNYQQTHMDCPLVSKTTGTTYKLGFVGSYSSPYMDLMNFCLIRFQEYGIIHRLRNYEQPQRLVNIYNDIKSVKITSVFPMVLILIVGIVLSLFILLVEIIHARSANQKLVTRKYHYSSNRYMN